MAKPEFPQNTTGKERREPRLEDQANTGSSTSEPAAVTPNTAAFLVPLDLVDSNPYQYRTELDEDRLNELAASIKESGQLQAVTVRQAGDRYQLIGGHRRREAIQRLRDHAPDDEQRQRWSTIKAELRTNVSDDEMERFALIENLLRDDPNPVDTAHGLASYQRRFATAANPTGLSTQEMARRLGLDQTRIKRLLQLSAAPQVIKDGCSKGIRITLLDEHGQPLKTPQGREKQEHRQLDMLAGLELARLYSHLARTKTQERAASQIETLVERALRKGWSLRRIQDLCQQLRMPKAEQPDEGDGAPESPAETEPKPAFEDTAETLVIHKRRLGTLDEAGKKTLRATFERALKASMP